MGLFGHKRMPPRTTFGYEPPEDAVLRSWICSDKCGAGDVEPDLRRWPKRCPGCGGEICTNLLEEPWAHAAKRVEIDSRIRSPRFEHDREIAQNDDRLWWFREALTRGDRERAERQREIIRNNPAFLGPGYNSFAIVQYALETSYFDLALDELQQWRTRTSFEDLARDNERRTNARQLASQLIAFYETPEISNDAARAQTAYALLGEVMQGLGQEASGGNTEGWERIQRKRSGGYGEIERMTRVLESACRLDQHQGTSSGALPPQTPQRMAVRGWYELNMQGSGMNGGLVWEATGQPYIPLATSQPLRFAELMAADTLPHGGLCVVGAARCLWDLLDESGRKSSAFLAVLDASLDYRRRQGTSPLNIAPYEMDRWLLTHPGETW